MSVNTPASWSGSEDAAGDAVWAGSLGRVNTFKEKERLLCVFRRNQFQYCSKANANTHTAEMSRV